MNFPPVPPEIKSIAHVLKVADEHDNRNIVVSYWARMYACQTAMKLLPGHKPPAVAKLLMAIMDWLEETKKANHELEGITNEVVAQAMIEEYCLKLFTYADSQDRAEQFHKNMIKAFYTCGILMDTLEQFGDLSEDLQNKRKYAKWKAAYIHNCLKTGDIPTAGGPDEHLNNVIDVGGQNDDESQNSSDNFGNTSSFSADPPAPPPTVTSPTKPVTPPPATYTPVTPSTPAEPKPATSSAPSNGSVNADAIQKAQKYCKFASSALNYDDVKTAIDNLTKALSLLQYGKEA